MKFLETKQEMAQAINLGKYQVLTMDINNTFKIGNKVVGFIGCKVRKNERTFRGVTLFDRCELCWFEDEKRFVLSEQSTCLSSSYSYVDLMEDVEFANSPIITKDEVVIVVYDSKTQRSLTPMIYDLKSKEQIDLIELFRK